MQKRGKEKQTTRVFVFVCSSTATPKQKPLEETQKAKSKK
jgi:hypothetical protein